MLGAGNVATHLGARLLQTGADIRQVYSRTDQSAKELEDFCMFLIVQIPTGLDKTADFYIYTIKDNALSEVASKILVPEPFTFTQQEVSPL